MTNSTGKPTVPPWLYKLFTGHQYPYVRRLAKFGQVVKPGEDRPEPTKEMIEAKFWDVYPRCRMKVLQEVKEGMIVSFMNRLSILRWLSELVESGGVSGKTHSARRRSRSISTKKIISSARSTLKLRAGRSTNIRSGLRTKC